MSPPRFYCPQLASSPTATAVRYLLDPAEARHATSVLRMRVDDVLSLFDGQGRSAHARVIEAKRDTVAVEVIEWLAPKRELSAELTLAIALPKGDRQKVLVDAATELGVTRLVPILCQRGVAQPTDNALDRLRRQVIEACKQCGRDRLMEITSPQSLSELILEHSDPAMLRCVAHPYDSTGQRRHLNSCLQSAARPTIIAIGPEGGFTDDEVKQLLDANWQAVDLGPLILRIEVAAIAAVAQIVGCYNLTKNGI